MAGIDIKKPFGVSVKAWRDRLGLSQEKLAERAGVHRTYIGMIERAEKNITLENIQKDHRETGKRAEMARRKDR